MINYPLLMILLMGFLLPNKNSFLMQDSLSGWRGTATRGSVAVNPLPSGGDSTNLYRNIVWANWGNGYVFRGGAGIARPKGVLSAAFLDDGRTVVVGEAHRIVMWDGKTGRIMKLLGLSREGTTSVCNLPGDSLFATATGDLISIWDARSLTLEDSICEAGTIRELEFSSRGNLLLTVTDSDKNGHDARLWDYRSKRVLDDFRKSFRDVYSAGLSPDGGSIVLGISGDLAEPGHDGYSIVLYDVAVDKVVQRHAIGTQRPTCVRFSPDGKFVASGLEYVESRWGEPSDTTLKVWNVSGGDSVLACADHPSSIAGLAFCPGTDVIATVAEDGYVSLHELNGSEREVPQPNGMNSQMPLVFSPKGKLLLVGSTDTRTAVYDVARDSLVRVLDPHLREGHSASVWAVAYSDDGKLVASGDNGDNLFLWRASDGKRLRSIKSGTVSALSFSPDGRLIATNYFRSPVVKLWDTRTGSLKSEFRCSTSGVIGTEFSSDNEYLLSSGEGANICLWDVASGKCVEQYSVKKGAVSYTPSVATFCANDSIVVAAVPGVIRFLDTRHGNLIRTFADSSGSWSLTCDYQDVFVTKGDEFLIACGQEGRQRLCRIWDAKTGRLIRKFETGFYYRAVALSPKGRFLVTGGLGMVTKVWSIPSGDEAFEISDYRDVPYGYAWSPDGRRILCGMTDGSLIMYKFPESIR